LWTDEADVCMYIRTEGRTVRPALLGQLKEVDLITQIRKRIHFISLKLY